ncbi:MAG: hypothetical protein IIB42_03570, partial [Candidatus Marinimicrobia bacterium]|nr:hypothetical protein [Candidatus Neomarinimicrobiota bacterium]
MLPKRELADLFRNKFPDSFLEVTDFRGMLTIHIRGRGVLEVLRTLKTDRRFAFNFLCAITSVDHL